MDKPLKAYLMRKQGFTYIQIGKELGMSSWGASSLVRRGDRQLKNIEIAKKHLGRIQGFPDDLYGVWIG